MTTSATAVQSPDRDSAEPMCSANVSLRDTASLPAVVEARIKKASTPVEMAITAPRSRVASASASPAAKPAGSHATTMRRNGCEPRRASSSSGSAPDTAGPCASR
jgi:hypothetical protein